MLFKITKAVVIMKKKTEKKLMLGKIKVATLNNKSQQAIQGGIPPQTAPIVCQPTKVCASNKIHVCHTQVCELHG